MQTFDSELREPWALKLFSGRNIILVFGAVILFVALGAFFPRDTSTLTPAQTDHVDTIRGNIESDSRLDTAIIELRGGTYGMVQKYDPMSKKLTVIFPKLKDPVVTFSTKDSSWMFIITRIVRNFDVDYPAACEQFLPQSKKTAYSR